MENVEVASMAMAKKINGEDGLLAAIAATGSSVQAANGRLPVIVDLIVSNAEMCTRYATEFEITEAATRSRIAPIADLVETVYLLLPRVSHAFAELSAGGDARSEALRNGIVTFGPTNLEKIEAVYTKVADAEEHLEKLNTLLRGSSNLSSRSGKVSSARARRSSVSSRRASVTDGSRNSSSKSVDSSPTNAPQRTSPSAVRPGLLAQSNQNKRKLHHVNELAMVASTLASMADHVAVVEQREEVLKSIRRSGFQEGREMREACCQMKRDKIGIRIKVEAARDLFEPVADDIRTRVEVESAKLIAKRKRIEDRLAQLQRQLAAGWFCSFAFSLRISSPLFLMFSYSCQSRSS